MIYNVGGGDGFVAKLCSTLAILWIIAIQASLWGFPRQEYWNGQPIPFSGDLPDPGIELGCLALQADSLLIESPRITNKTAKAAQCWGKHTVQFHLHEVHRFMGSGYLGEMQNKGHGDFWDTGHAISTVTWMVIPQVCLLIFSYPLWTTYTPIHKVAGFLSIKFSSPLRMAEFSLHLWLHHHHIY